ncbi:hypothetical protein [Streptomyces pseudogriseolus]|uniref:hypothetical protein n=1 Tax=Streptomyces pseudogriseolus TaxID=36817 RepID=UPI003FA2139F
MTNGTEISFADLIDRHAATVGAIIGVDAVRSGREEFVQYVKVAAEVLPMAWCRDSFDMAAAHAHLASAVNRDSHPASQRKLLKLAQDRLSAYRQSDFVA